MDASAQIVVLDPGHGGSDPGAVGCGLEEAAAVLDVSQRTASLLRAEGLTVFTTRSDDRFVTLTGRSAFANDRGASRFVSIHANANAGTPATGTETFVHTSASSASREMGGDVQRELIATWGLRDRGLKSANFSVLRRTSMPAALAELGFINRCDIDATFLGSASERARIAAAIARGILDSLGRTGPVDPPPVTPPPVDPPPAPTLGRLIGVAFEDTGAGLEDTTLRLEGASVSVDGEPAQVTGANGNFRFDLSPGTYTVRVARDGFTSSSRTCTVRANADNWCSVGLAPGVSSVTVRGVVYVDTGAGPAGAERISGARVEADGGISVTSGPDGLFTFETAPAALTLEASKAGYLNATRACTVAAGETWCSIGLRPEPVVSTGVLQGVVYVDGDISRRIPDAEVVILGTSERTRTDGRSGYYRFELPAGTYQVDIRQGGFVDATRTCEVRADAETWCSVALVRTGSTTSGIEVVDERPPEEAAPLPGNRVLTSNSCSASGSGSAPWSLILLGLLALRRRRRAFGAGVLGALLCLGVSACGSADPVEAARAELVEADNDALGLVQEVPSFARVSSEVLTHGDYVDATIAPVGRRVALSHAGYRAISVYDAGELTLLREGTRSGYAPVWNAEGTVLGVREAHQTATAAPIHAFHVDGTPAAPVGGQQAMRVRTEDGAIVLRRGSVDIARLGPEGDRYFDAHIDPSAEFVVFQGMSTGLYLHRIADGQTFMVGAGSSARFGGRYLIFERLAEDGHDVTDAGLWLTDLRDQALRTGPIEGAEGASSPSLNDEFAAFLVGEEVRLGQLEVR